MDERPLRLAPLPDEEWDERVDIALAGLVPEHRRNPQRAGNLLGTLARHPDLARTFLAFNAHLLLNSTLPKRLGELVILRVARRRGCGYEWAHHARRAGKLGFSAAEIEAAGDGKAAGELEAAVLAAVDELDVDSTVSDETWSTLGAHLDERQRMDLVFTIGAYCMVAMAINTFGVALEEQAKPAATRNQD
jgi:4-carboxymuconolactone decarboxylase